MPCNRPKSPQGTPHVKLLFSRLVSFFTCDLSSCFAALANLWSRPEQQVAGKTLGVIGYGDIGQSAARKAKAMGMNVVAQRRRPERSQGDGIADEVLGVGQVREA